MKVKGIKLIALLITLTTFLGGLCVPMNARANDKREAFINIALGEAGTSYDSNGHTKYGIWCGYPSAQWCAAFISWCANQVGISVTSNPKEINVSGMKTYFKNADRFYSTPQRGDIAIMSGHVGIVTDVQGDKVYTVEGNTKDWRDGKYKVMVLDGNTGISAHANCRSRNAFEGFGRPDFGGNTGTSVIFSSSGSATEITDTSAKISAKLNGTYNVSTCGFDIGLSPETMGRVTENANTKVNSMWYSLGNGSKWYGTLQPGTTYYYRFYAIINGVEHTGAVQSFTTLARNPQGNVDSIIGGNGCFNISGWAFDRDDLSKALEIHVYLGNENAPEELCAVIEANKSRQDVNDAYPDVGANHGFEQTIATNRTGNQTIYVYAINVGSGKENPLLGKQTITIAKDIEAPIITNAYISESTKEKFTIIINANDNCGIENVWLDLANAKTNVATILNKATKIGEGIYSYTLDESTANNMLRGYEGKYTISIEAIDKEWNYSKEYKLEHVVDLTFPTISNVQVTDVSETGYTVTCTVVDDVQLNRVQFPTWTAANGQDDLAQDWWNNTSITGKINGSQVSFRVNASDHNNETGVYRTHIYAIDSCGNSVCYEIPDIIVKQNNPFNDVQEGRFFYDPVLWAVKNNITTGTSPVTFSPDDPCTRAQVVTFIWRAINRPEAFNKSTFVDLREGAYYLDAVDWAVENKITTGTSPNTFSPDEACTRAQIVTFLWRVAGCPKPSKESAFEDLREGAYYLDAVSWAVEEGITIGTSPTKFSPDEKCSRAQVVTFLYRYIY